MRLTQLKLSGFKSFVDPTIITVPGQLVGVVGPNGCGKSNIIDAVRWVLGESKASALRGESMQDVIFNGSSLRKPVARASVELVFDNSLGKAAGQWSQYAEISVKRVLTREGDSTYLINNTVVRRRDVQDIFLGTGVGPRAYAIIEQGMISRVIEAKPEELRVFLEEAAGVSKYKERRRETENRLEDTRENLARVEDIRRELDAQIEKLAQQAEVAKQYKSYQTEARDKQNMLWALRKRDAETDAERVKREIDKALNEVEAETARLREIESRLEAVRTEHYAAVDKVNDAQGAFYAVNSEVSRLETEIRYLVEKRQRLDAQAAQLDLQLEQWSQQHADLGEANGMWQERRSAAAERIAQAQARNTAEKEKLPQADERFRSTQTRVNESRDAVARAEHALQIEQTHLAHAGKSLQQLEAREERLLAERDALTAADPQKLNELQQAVASAQAALNETSGTIGKLQTRIPELEAARGGTLENLQNLQREGHTLEGRLSTLQKIQAQVEQSGKIQDWLGKHGLQDLPRLWQNLKVDAGWETAVESVLRERVHALALSDPEMLQKLLDDVPPAKLSVFSRDSAPTTDAREDNLSPLSDHVRSGDAAITALVQDWLLGFYAVDGVPRLMARMALRPGAVLVNREGHQFTRYAVSFHGPDSGDAGILARQREIEGLSAEVVQSAQRILDARQAHTAAEQSLSEARAELAQWRDRESAANREHHALQMELLRLSENESRIRERGAQISTELDEIAEQKTSEHARQREAETQLDSHQEEIDRLYADFETVKTEYEQAGRLLESQRQTLQQAERELQEAQFSERECVGKLEEIERSRANLNEQIERGRAEQERTRGELSAIREDGLHEQLQTQLAERTRKEQALAEARDRQEELTHLLRSADEERSLCEQGLQPLRERVGELRLKEQAARLSYEQFAEQLAAAGVDEAVLAQMLEQNKLRPNALQAEINRLNQAMSELGAINMAALEELAASTERKNFLDAQASDLGEALETLESAIRRIDRETREMLQQTFDEVNAHFGRMFPTLFGGGEAKLVMTGDEILDAGIEVQAHPPGKRNSSIHLLSGGEKALTAISLVFSLFQLNPAPFCLLDEVDAPLDDSNTERFCKLVQQMSENTQFLFISHNKITMGLASQLVGVTMQESGVSRVVAVDIEAAMRMTEAQAA
ncbi:MAG TPA: chromosome segregation protein SMC [Burkholderiales bacterium]|nr:chromosome segregation protein SMC [Burkholderiales bacterium]